MIHTKFILAVTCIFMALAGCKDLIPPSVTSTTPPDGAVDVNRSADITVTFDEDIFSETVDESTFVLAGDGAINGAVSFDALANIVTFTPSTRLAPLKTYQATLTTGITDLVGNSLASDYTWSFTTADLAGIGVEQIPGIDAERVSSLQVGIDGTGNAIVVWQQYGEIWATYYIVDSGWKTPEVIGEGVVPHLAVNASDDAIVVWRGAGSIFARRYSTSSGWEEAESIDGDLGSISIDEKGNAMLVWVSGSGGFIAFNHYVVGSGWKGAKLIDIGYDFEMPVVGMDADGNAIAGWNINGDWFSSSVCNSRYTPDEGWSALWCAGARPLGHQKLKVSSSGNAIVVYSHRGLEALPLEARYYTVGSGWELESVGEYYDYYDSSPIGGLDSQVNIDPNGNVIIVRRDEVYDAGYVATYYSPESGWAADAEMVTENLNAEGIRLDGDTGGNAIAVWYESADCDNAKPGQIWANRYVAGSGWGDEEKLEAATSDCFTVGPVHLDVNGKGDGIAVWTLSDSGHTTLWAYRFE